MAEGAEITPVRRSSLPEQVLEHLRRAILSGSIKAGERIKEEEIATRMQTSRGPVRDALIQLEHEGLIIRERNRGAMVVNLSAEDVEEVCSLRAVLEELALRYATQRATEQDIAGLERILEEFSACLKSDDFSLERAVDLDLQFHEQVVNISRHRRLIGYWQSLKSQIWFLIFSRNVFDERGFPRDSAVWHAEMIRAIRERDVAKGMQHLKLHLGGSYDSLVATYRKRMTSDEGVD